MEDMKHHHNIESNTQKHLITPQIIVFQNDEARHKVNVGSRHLVASLTINSEHSHYAIHVSS